VHHAVLRKRGFPGSVRIAPNCRFERVATRGLGGHKADVTSQPTKAARRWASISTAVLGSAGN
jgi:hypothetical protein